MTRVTQWLLFMGAGLVLLTSLPARAAVPALRDVPAGIPPAAREALVKEHDRLATIRDGIRNDLVPHNQRCAAVEAGTPAAAACAEAQKTLQQRVRAYGDAVERFHAALDRAVSGRPARGPEWPASVEARGEAVIIRPDGRQLPATGSTHAFLADGDRIVTGPDGHIRLILPDQTTCTVGPNSDLGVDKFLFDPNPTIWVTLTKGLLRWVTGNVKPDPGKMKVTLPAGYTGIRGTDFEATVDLSGGGRIVLAVGELEITEKKTGRTFRLTAGQSVAFTSDGTFGRPSGGGASAGPEAALSTFQIRPVCPDGNTGGTRLPRTAGGDPVCVTDSVLLDAAQIYYAQAEPLKVGSGYTVVVYWTEAGKAAFAAAIGPYLGKQVALVAGDGVAALATVKGQLAQLQPTPPSTILAVVGGPVLEFAPVSEFLARALADAITAAAPRGPWLRRKLVPEKGTP